MKTFYVIWTYVANYSGLITVEAESADAAKQQVLDRYGAEFADAARIFVFDAPPVIDTGR